MSAEATVVRNYIDTLVNLPWTKKTKIKHDLQFAEQVLSEDHYGLEKVKDRILEYLAVQQRVDKVKAPILCLGRPPGRGQDLARPERWRAPPGASSSAWPSVACATRPRSAGTAAPTSAPCRARCCRACRRSARAQPAVPARRDRQAGHGLPRRPVDARCWRCWTPSRTTRSADHYIEVDYDLSDTMFIATSNSLNIPPALLDRMEVIRLSGYTEDEKVHIAQRYLLPKQRRRTTASRRRRLEVTEVRDPRHHPLLHAGSRRAFARARGLEDLPQGGQGSSS